MSRPLVSIITPCYNGEKYIEKLLDSVLAQDYNPIQMIVVDDGSTDRSLEILEGYKPKFEKRKGWELRISSKEHAGAAAAINQGLKQFTGEYVTFIDVDDFLNEGAVKERVKFLEKNKNYDAVFSEVHVVDASDYGKVTETLKQTPPYRTNLFLDILLEKNYIWTPVYFLRSSYFLSVHPKRHIAEFKAGQNIQLFLPLWYQGVVGYIDKPLVTIVSHNDSHSRIERGRDEEEKRQKEIEYIYLDTLKKIGMPDEERQEYIRMVRDKYAQKNKRIFYVRVNDKDELTQLFDYDEQKFRDSHTADTEAANQTQLASKLAFFSHSLEKGLSNDNFEIGHGFRVAQWLIDMLRVYRAKGYDQNHLSYINTLSVLNEFYDRHKGTELAGDVENIFSEWLSDIDNCQAGIGGSIEIRADDKRNNDKKNFKQLAEGRAAVRSYSDKPVDKKDIEEAIAIAMKTPTVCNRQSIRVHAMYEKDVIEKVLEVQGGIAHYETPPVLLLITADDNGYFWANERNQGFIDGGLFAMSLLYALEYKKLAACPLHAMFTEVPEKTIRGMLGLPDKEKLITFISVGHFKENSTTCKSFRYTVDYVLSEVDRIHDFEIQTIDERTANAEPEQDPGMVLKIRQKLRIRTRLIALKKRLRPRTRLLNALRRIKHATRIRTRARKLLAAAKAYLERRRIERAEGAILTLTGYFNYGNILQRYALQKFLRRNGHHFVSYIDTHSGAADISRIDKDNIAAYPEAFGQENTIRFVQKYILTKPFDASDNYRSYIVGSDQIWRNWWEDQAVFGYYFLNFLKDRKANRIAYAASFGKDKVEDVMSQDDVAYIRPYIEQFNSIFVREKSAVEMIEKAWGLKNAKTVVDPTLLLKKSDYSKLIDRSDVRNEKIEPIFTYIVGETKDILGFVQRFSDIRRQQVSKIRVHAGAENDILPPVELWLKGFRDAELVITNSFHGMMFSVLNNTDFIIIGKEAGGLSRIRDFLSECGIEGRFISESELADFDVSKLKPIDWRSVNKKLGKMVKESGDLLLDAVRRTL